MQLPSPPPGPESLDPRRPIVRFIVGPENRETIDFDLRIPAEVRYATIAAGSALLAGQLEAAFDLLMSVRTDGAGRDATWHYYLGATYAAMRKPKRARDAFRSSLNIQPDSFNVRLALALSHSLLKEWDRAYNELRRLKRAMKGVPRSLARIAHAEGLVALQQNDSERAETALTRAIDLDPKNPEAYTALAGLFALQAENIHSRKADEAMGVFQRLAAVRPDLAEPHAQLGAFLLRRGDLDGAVAAFHEALARDPDHPETLIRMGNALLGAGHANDAVAVYEALGGQNSENVTLLNMLGAAYGRAGRPTEAATALRRAIELGSEQSITYSNLGSALYDLGEYGAAGMATLRALKLDPTSPWARVNILEILQAIVANVEAQEDGSPMSTQYVRLPTDHWEVIKGWLESDLEKASKIREVLDSAEFEEPDDHDSQSAATNEQEPDEISGFNVPSREAATVSERAAASMQWIAEHRAEYAGQWVAMDGARLVAHGADARAVADQARRLGVSVPFLHRVEAEEPAAFWGGWL